MTGCRAVLLDIDGTLTDGLGGPALPSTVEAVRALSGRLPLRCVTNATSWTRKDLTAALVREGFPFSEAEVVTPTILARQVLKERGHDQGVLIASVTALADLDWFHQVPPGEARAVLVASEAHDRQVSALQPAVDALLAGAPLYTLQPNRVFKRAGRWIPDLGPVAAYLGYAANCGWENLGKPSPLLFQAMASDLGCSVDEMAMVGDDAEFDASGAIRAGVGWGILVRTGKYRSGAENRVAPPPTCVIDNLLEILSLP